MRPTLSRRINDIDVRGRLRALIRFNEADAFASDQPEPGFGGAAHDVVLQ